MLFHKIWILRVFFVFLLLISKNVILLGNDFATEKERLLKQSEKYRTAIKEQFKNAKVTVQDTAQDVVIVGGVLLASYIVFQIFKTEDEPVTAKALPSVDEPAFGNLLVMPRKEDENILLKSIKEHIAMFLISIAKKKLQEFLDGCGNSQENNISLEDER